VGKTTVAKRLGIPQVISTTTRPMREGERHGETYHYVSREEFNQLDLIERVVYSGNYYGLQTKDVQEALDSGGDHYVILDRKGCVIMKRMFEDVRVIYMKAKPMELVKYMFSRGDTPMQVIERLCNMITDKELENDDVADLIVVNTNLDQVEREIKEYIKGD
jgi:guanylate kinase